MKTSNNALINFLSEALARLFKKSPIFFQIWTYISLGLVLITGVPEVINLISGFVAIPDLWNVQITTAVAWASRAALFMSMLTVQSKSVATADDGSVVTITDSKALPFTTNIEKKNANSIQL